MYLDYTVCAVAFKVFVCKGKSNLDTSVTDISNYLLYPKI